ncbi:hypothetical protein [Micromonospora okii]|uniref:hypothetical protein n=1 Tax=Micromonospora okii TaxID=1182970 RepID=UPI001E47A52F|nr:hypothetical protein [Micromonospora okii]
MTAPTTTNHVVLTLDGAGAAPGLDGAMRWTPPAQAAEVRAVRDAVLAATKPASTREGRAVAAQTAAVAGYTALTDARDYLRALGDVMNRHMPNEDTGRCREDRKTWPCPTMRDIAPALGVTLPGAPA